jgi:glycosyltransferase involved in cell wall biosynthesis
MGLAHLTKYLQASDCFVLPSASEGLSNALLEAMACGLPVVASAVGGSLDIIVDRENGLLVTPGNGQELGEAIECVLTNTSWAEQLGRSARQTVEAGYSLDITSQRLRELYVSLLGWN